MRILQISREQTTTDRGHAMQIREIRISRSYHHDSKFKCEISLDTDYGAMTLLMPEDRVNTIIDAVADLITDAGKDVAENLSRQALAHTAIEHKADSA